MLSWRWPRLGYLWGALALWLVGCLLGGAYGLPVKAWQWLPLCLLVPAIAAQVEDKRAALALFAVLGALVWWQGLASVLASEPRIWLALLPAIAWFGWTGWRGDSDEGLGFALGFIWLALVIGIDGSLLIAQLAGALAAFAGFRALLGAFAGIKVAPAANARVERVNDNPRACTSNWWAMEKSAAPVPPRLGAVNTPVSKAPKMPPTPWMPNTSSVSSAPSIRLRPPIPHRQTKPAKPPMAMEPIGPTLPQAGVMATKPATAPDAAPSIEALPLCKASPMLQVNTAAEVANRVFTNARAAPPLASKLEPALKPNQPTHSRDAPTMVKVRLCGAMDSLP